jgi:hypothetical protein
MESGKQGSGEHPMTERIGKYAQNHAGIINPLKKWMEPHLMEDIIHKKILKKCNLTYSLLQISSSQ